MPSVSRLTVALGAILALGASCNESSDVTVSAADSAGAGETSEGGDSLAGPDTHSQDVAPDVGPDVTPEPVTTFRFEEVIFDGSPMTWGAVTAGNLLIGGVEQLGSPQDGVYAAEPHGTGFAAHPVATLATGRYCHCVAYDPTRGELLVVGGRGAGFVETPTAELVSLSTGDGLSIDAGGPADYPVGCRAYFSAPNDRAYVFGGLSGEKQGFSSTTWRFNWAKREFEALAATGPAARYDSAIHAMNDGGALLVSGMGRETGVVFYDDIWRFDAGTETWAEIETASGDSPPGRRYAWSALAPDESVLIYGYGSDAPDGRSVMDDLWIFTFGTRTWAPLDVDGPHPDARGFTSNWQIAPGEAGVLAFGSEQNTNVLLDAYVLRVPDALRGAWH